MKRILAALLAGLLASPASAAVVQIGVKDAAGTTRNFNVTTNTDITGNLDGNVVVCDQAAGTTCASVGTAGAPSTNALTIQAVTLGHGTAANAMRVELPTDGTGLVNAAQSGTWNIGTVTTVTTVSASRTVGNTGAVLDGVIGAATAPANMFVTGGVFNSTPLTVANGQSAALQTDANGFLKVNVAAGGAGGTSMTDHGTFTQSTTAITPIGCLFINSYAALTTGQAGVASCTSGGAVNVNMVNAVALGQQTMANSSPVAIASNQSAYPVQAFTVNNVNAQGHVCGNASGVIHVTTNTDTQVVASSGSTNIFVCDYEFQLTGVGSAYLERAAAGGCASAFTQLTPLWTGLAGTPIGKAGGNSFYRGINTGTTNNTLCVHTAGLSSTTLDIQVFYDQY